MSPGVLQAIEFVQMQRDDELWELLISLALESPALTGNTCPFAFAFLAYLASCGSVSPGLSCCALTCFVILTLCESISNPVSM